MVYILFNNSILTALELSLYSFYLCEASINDNIFYGLSSDARNVKIDTFNNFSASMDTRHYFIILAHLNVFVSGEFLWITVWLFSAESTESLTEKSSMFSACSLQNIIIFNILKMSCTQWKFLQVKSMLMMFKVLLNGLTYICLSFFGSHFLLCSAQHRIFWICNHLVLEITS